MFTHGTVFEQVHSYKPVICIEARTIVSAAVRENESTLFEQSESSTE